MLAVVCCDVQELEQNEERTVDYGRKLAELDDDETLLQGAATLGATNDDFPFRGYC